MCVFSHMTGLLARPARETRKRRAEGAKASAAERRDCEGSGPAAAGLGAASLGTVPAIAALLPGLGLVRGRLGWLVAHGGCCEVERSSLTRTDLSLSLLPPAGPCHRQ